MFILPFPATTPLATASPPARPQYTVPPCTATPTIAQSSLDASLTTMLTLPFCELELELLLPFPPQATSVSVSVASKTAGSNFILAREFITASFINVVVLD